MPARTVFGFRITWHARTARHRPRAGIVSGQGQFDIAAIVFQ